MGWLLKNKYEKFYAELVAICKAAFEYAQLEIKEIPGRRRRRRQTEARFHLTFQAHFDSSFNSYETKLLKRLLRVVDIRSDNDVNAAYNDLIKARDRYFEELFAKEEEFVDKVLAARFDENSEFNKKLPSELANAVSPKILES